MIFPTLDNERDYYPVSASGYPQSESDPSLISFSSSSSSSDSSSESFLLLLLAFSAFALGFGLDLALDFCFLWITEHHLNVRRNHWILSF